MLTRWNRFSMLCSIKEFWSPNFCVSSILQPLRTCWKVQLIIKYKYCISFLQTFVLPNNDKFLFHIIAHFHISFGIIRYIGDMFVVPNYLVYKLSSTDLSFNLTIPTSLGVIRWLGNIRNGGILVRCLWMSVLVPPVGHWSERRQLLNLCQSGQHFRLEKLRANSPGNNGRQLRHSISITLWF